MNSGQFLIDSSFVMFQFVLLCHMTRFLACPHVDLLK